MRAQLG